MRETLYIRLRSGDPGALTSYCIAAPNAVASFDVREATLEWILAEASTRRIVLLVPGADVRLTQVQVPARQAARVLQAAPYALEDQLAEDVDTLHFALGPRRADGQWPVAVVAKARIDAWLQPFNERGLRPDALVPEILALPAAEGERWSALVETDQVTVRTAACAGFGCVPEDLPLMLQLADPEKLCTLRIIVPRNVSTDFTVLERPVELLPGFATGLEALLQHLRLDSALNLLQGAYSQRRDLQRAWQPWRTAAALAGGLFLAVVLLHGISAWRLGRELAALEAANVTRYQEVFPAEQRIVNLPVQVDQQMARLKTAPGKGSALTLMETLGAALAAAPGLSVQSMQFREGALYVSLTGSDLQVLESLRTWFSGRREVVFEVQSANSGTEGAQIKVRLAPAPVA
ncbi:MAG TPA: type II secretion system protein GspL [Solimonas sp.]|nr:type II secretion system protein GspL [Solimonas sp.]